MDVSQLIDLPDLVLVIVGEEMVLQPSPQLRKHENHLLKLLLGQVAHHRIVFGSDTCASSLFGNERVLSEKVTRSERPYKNVPLLDGIFDKHLELTSFDEIESVAIFSLIDQWVFRIQQLQRHRPNKKVNQNLVFLKNEAFKGLVVENKLDYLVL